MAHFRYLGEPPNSAILVMGPTLQIRCRCKDGTVDIYDPIPPAVSFPIGDDIGYDITDPTALYQMRADTRFKEI